jgi:hypothetical protein
VNELRNEIMRTHAAVARGERGAKARLERLQAEYRTSGATIERPGGSATLIESRPVTSLRPRRVKQQAQVARDLPFGHPPSEVVIRARSTEPTQYTVTLGSGARRAIEDELVLVRRELGPDFEAGGWLYGQYRPRESSTWTTIAVATHAGDSEHGRSSITFGESATALMLRSFPPDLGHMKHLGDWHSHPNPGSTIPSDGDARGWARSLDEYGFARYSGIIISPSETLGWANPVFSAWTVRREGVPSLPVCEPARLDW